MLRFALGPAIWLQIEFSIDYVLRLMYKVRSLAH
jgi:hypothetical protein